MAFLTNTFSAPAPLGEKISALWAQVIEARAKRAVYKQTVNELNNLSTRDLADLGIHHSMIKRLAYEAAYES